MDELSNQQIWAQEQMDKAEIPAQYRASLKSLLGTFWRLSEEEQFTADDSKIILAVLTELAQMHALPDPVHEQEAVWVQAKPGALTVRDIVRVRANAYSGEVGIAHNGKEGRIVSIRYGDIHVRYDDAQPGDMPVKHTAASLEKRIR